jgi:hypothetical protein
MPTGKVTRLLVLTVALTLPMPAPPAAAAARERMENVPAASRDWRDELRLLGEAIRRLATRSDGFAARLNVALHGGRRAGTSREGRTDAAAGEFRRAAWRLRNAFDELDYYSSRPEARELIRGATRLDRLLARSRPGRRVKADWGVTSEDLLFVANAYNLDYGR